MPIYEYACPSCGEDFDVIQKVSDPTPECPACGHAEVRKKVSKTNFQLKGGGWYVTEYGSSKKPKKETSETKTESASSDSSSSESSSSDTSSDSSSASSSDTSSTSSTSTSTPN